MSTMPDASRRERFAEFLRRLATVQRAANVDEAMQQIHDILNQVVNEMTSIPYDPSLPLNDGRTLRDGARP